MRNRIISGFIGAILLPTVVIADVSVEVSGFVRQESAVSVGSANGFNQYGNDFNGPVVNSLGTTITRAQTGSDPTWNHFVTRGELDFNIRFNDNWDAFIKLRGLYHWSLDDEFDDEAFYTSGFSGNKGNTLEVSGDQYMLDIPAIYFDNNGPLWLRLGNQQIAWGEAIFSACLML